MRMQWWFRMARMTAAMGHRRHRTSAWPLGVCSPATTTQSSTAQGCAQQDSRRHGVRCEEMQVPVLARTSAARASWRQQQQQPWTHAPLSVPKLHCAVAAMRCVLSG
jgi:hypothetical protein